MRLRPRGRIDSFIDSLQAEGRYAFDLAEASGVTEMTDSGLKAALQRLQRTGRITRPFPRRPFFIIVPPEFRSMGAPPLGWYLDALMWHLGQPAYYAGLLTAAEWHGASHHAIQETQIVVAGQVHPVRLGREQVRFVTKTDAARTPVERRATEGGFVRLSTPEATAIDLVRYLSVAGGTSVVATVLGEMTLGAAPLRSALEAASDVTAAQRLGYLLERAGQQSAARVVARWLSGRPTRSRLLDPRGSTRESRRAEPWGVLVNSPVEVSR